jgi:hypothetical protein
VSRMYGEPVEVKDEEGRPVRFVWRGRLYTVLGVLEQWVISREWWQRNDPDAEVPAEREFWRVEAKIPDVPSVICELRRDAEAGDWLLVRIWD